MIVEGRDVNAGITQLLHDGPDLVFGHSQVRSAEGKLVCGATKARKSELSVFGVRLANDYNDEENNDNRYTRI